MENFHEPCLITEEYLVNFCCILRLQEDVSANYDPWILGRRAWTMAKR